MRRLALETSVRATFSSPTLTAPGPSRPRAPPEPTSCSSGPVPAESETSTEAAVDLTSEVELQKRIDEWKEVALFLRRNVVQGVKDDTGAYRMSSLIPSSHSLSLAHRSSHSTHGIHLRFSWCERLPPLPCAPSRLLYQMELTPDCFPRKLIPQVFESHQIQNWETTHRYAAHQSCPLHRSRIAIAEEEPLQPPIYQQHPRKELKQSSVRSVATCTSLWHLIFAPLMQWHRYPKMSSSRDMAILQCVW